MASYMASHPHDVAKAVFTSPAPIDYAQWPGSGSVTSRLPAAQRQRADSLIPGSLRFIAWYALGAINPAAAHHFVSDAEADAFFNTFLQIVIYLDQPRPYLDTIQSFLLGQPLPVRPQTTARPCQDKRLTQPHPLVVPGCGSNEQTDTQART